MMTESYSDEDYKGMIMNTRVPHDDMEFALLEACGRDDAARLRWLLANGRKAQISRFLADKSGPFVAAEANAPRALHILLAAGADPEVRSRCGRRPLHACCANDGCECLELLTRYGADTKQLDDRGLTPKAIAEVYGARRCLAFFRYHLPTYKCPQPKSERRRRLLAELGRTKYPSNLANKTPLYMPHRNGAPITRDTVPFCSADVCCAISSSTISGEKHQAYFCTRY